MRSHPESAERMDSGVQGGDGMKQSIVKAGTIVLIAVLMVIYVRVR